MADNNANQPLKRPYHLTANPPTLSTDRATIHTQLLALLDRAENDPNLPALAFDDFMGTLTHEGQQLVHDIMQEMYPRWPEGVAYPNVVELVRYRQMARTVREENDRLRARQREAAERERRLREREREQAWANSIAGRLQNMARSAEGLVRGVAEGVTRWFPWRR